MNGIFKWVGIAVVVGGFYVYTNYIEEGSSGPDLAVTDIDLSRVLDVTIDTIVKVENDLSIVPDDKKSNDQAFLLFADELAEAYNAAQPPFDPEQIGVAPLKDASMLAYADINKDGNYDNQVEDAVFLIEIDGQNSRVIATSRIGGVSEHGFSGSGMLTGFLIGNMLSRQRTAGATSNVAQKKPISATQARARAGSGSHSRGK